MATDIWALSRDKGLFESFLKGYEEESGRKIDRSLESVYVVYASMLAVPYLYMLASKDMTKRTYAEKFHAFLREYFVNNI